MEGSEHPHNANASLNAKITELMSGLYRTMITNAYRWFLPRVERVVRAEGVPLSGISSKNSEEEVYNISGQYTYFRRSYEIFL